MKNIVILFVFLIGCNSPYHPRTPFTQEQCRKLCSPMSVALWTPDCYNDNRFMGNLVCHNVGETMPNVCRCGNAKVQTGNK